MEKFQSLEDHLQDMEILIQLEEGKGMFSVQKENFIKERRLFIL